MSADQEFEHDLSSALNRAGDDFQTELSPLLTGGVARGRRRWRRRSALNIAGAAAALALVGTGGVYASGLLHPAGGTTEAAAATPTQQPSMALSASATTAPPAPTADQVLAAFKSVLPQGTVTEASGRVMDTMGLADLRFDNGNGPGRMMLSVQRTTQPAQPCPDRQYWKLSWIDGCSVTKLPNGATLQILQGHEYSDHRADTKAWMATLTGPDHRQIEISEWNAAEEKGAAVNQEDPPLTPEQLTAAVSATVWDGIVAGLPEPKPIPQDRTMPGQQVLETGTKLLPAGVTTSKPSPREFDSTTVVVSDGTEQNLVMMMVRDMPKDSDLATKTMAGAQQLPDGTRVLVSPDGRFVTVLRPSGRCVQIGEPDQPAAGKRLVLSTDQLKTIALSPEWDHRG